MKRIKHESEIRPAAVSETVCAVVLGTPGSFSGSLKPSLQEMPKAVDLKIEKVLVSETMRLQ